MLQCCNADGDSCAAVSIVFVRGAGHYLCRHGQHTGDRMESRRQRQAWNWSLPCQSIMTRSDFTSHSDCARMLGYLTSRAVHAGRCAIQSTATGAWLVQRWRVIVAHPSRLIRGGEMADKQEAVGLPRNGYDAASPAPKIMRVTHGAEQRKTLDNSKKNLAARARSG